jgi:DNA-binding FrmR family transcriptional regulator
MEVGRHSLVDRIDVKRMQLESVDAKVALKSRLRRVEGQMRGVQRMVDEDRDCQEILQQLAAIRSAVQNASEFFLRTYAKECLVRAGAGDDDDREALIDDVMRLMVKIR